MEEIRIKETTDVSDIAETELIAEDEHVVTADEKFYRTSVKLYRVPYSPVWYIEAIDEVYRDSDMISAKVGEVIEPLEYTRKVFKIFLE